MKGVVVKIKGEIELTYDEYDTEIDNDSRKVDIVFGTDIEDASDSN